MQSFRENKIRTTANVFTMLVSLVACSIAEETMATVDTNDVIEKEKLFGASIDLGYVHPNMWAGWQLSLGPCIQPTIKFSIWKINLGIYMNFYGSEKDRFTNSANANANEGLPGRGKKGLGNCDEFQFFIDGGYEWKYFSFAASLWTLAYTWDYTDYLDTTITNALPKCTWFGRLSSSELTISPALNFGPFTIFTDQNFIVIAAKRDEAQSPTDSLQKYNIRKTDLGAYHGVLGFSWAKEMDDWSINLLAKTEWGSRKFIEPWLGSTLKRKLKDRNIEPHGIYHITFGVASSYNILPQLTISGNFNVEFITNRWIRYNDIKVAKGCIPYSGIHLTYNWSW